MSLQSYLMRFLPLENLPRGQLKKKWFVYFVQRMESINTLQFHTTQIQSPPHISYLHFFI